jgi:hypothetical protein
VSSTTEKAAWTSAGATSEGLATTVFGGEAGHKINVVAYAPTVASGAQWVKEKAARCGYRLHHIETRDLGDAWFPDGGAADESRGKQNAGKRGLVGQRDVNPFGRAIRMARFADRDNGAPAKAFDIELPHGPPFKGEQGFQRLSNRLRDRGQEVSINWLPGRQQGPNLH